MILAFFSTTASLCSHRMTRLWGTKLHEKKRFVFKQQTCIAWQLPKMKNKFNIFIFYFLLTSSRSETLCHAGL